jgi:hypothetical protein
MKTYWQCAINLSMTLAYILVVAFVKKIKLQLIKLMGLNFFILHTSGGGRITRLDGLAQEQNNNGRRVRVNRESNAKGVK